VSRIDTDSAGMLRALELAQAARGRTWPNPMVGCVVARDGQLLAEGVTQPCGQDHGEVDALKRLDFRADGATVYVNLEPCCHWGRTPPCTDALLRSGIRRVVVGMVDPHSAVAGQGIAQLRAAGLEVEVGVLEDACRAVNEAHVVFKTLGRPFVTLKGAVTLDGRTATRDRRSAWITGEPARAHARRERGLHQAVLVGVGTVLADDPQLTARDEALQREGIAEPARIVLDSRLRTPRTSRLLQGGGGPVWIATTDAAASSPAADALRAAGAELLPSGDAVTVPGVLAALAARGVATLFVEGGPTAVGAFLDAGVADRYLVYVAPRVFGGRDALPLALGEGVGDPAAATHLAPFSVTRLGDDLLLETRPLDGPAGPWWTRRHGGDG
jgi:diaminohydroxyphosphoribosylaminopyrimidine deaminase/5-amino-6-(5-phosphoribosylamino)uracil reductase